MIRPCIRLCSIAALRFGNTLAGPRVFDSDNSPLLEAMKDNEDSPYMTVYTDDDTRADIMGMDLTSSTRTILLIVEIGIASKIRDADKDPVLEIPASDEGMELGLDLLEWQATAALWQNPHNPWGEKLRRMVSRIRRVPSIRGAQAKEGVRYAARQISYHLGEVIADPVPGIPLQAYSPMREFIDAAKLDTEMALQTAASHLDAYLRGDANPEWRQIQAILGLTEQGIRGSGSGPLVMTDPDEQGAFLDTEDGSINPKEEPVP